MKLLVAIVHHDDAGSVIDGLLKNGYRATRLQSSGGFLKKSNATIIVGIDDDAVDDVISVIRANSKSRSQASDSAAATAGKVDLRPAVVFVLPIDHVERV
jgi:uncharacterized protein YaaQ